MPPPSTTPSNTIVDNVDDDDDDNDHDNLIVNSDGDDDDVICDKMPDAVWLALASTTPRLLHHTSSSGSQFHSSFLSAALAALYYTYLCASVSQT